MHMHISLYYEKKTTKGYLQIFVHNMIRTIAHTLNTKLGRVINCTKVSAPRGLLYCFTHRAFQNQNVDGLVQDCNNSIANALELLQSCTKLSMWTSGHSYVITAT